MAKRTERRALRFTLNGLEWRVNVINKFVGLNNAEWGRYLPSSR